MYNFLRIDKIFQSYNLEFLHKFKCLRPCTSGMLAICLMPKPSGHNNIIWIEARATLILLFCAEVFLISNMSYHNNNNNNKKQTYSVFASPIMFF